MAFGSPTGQRLFVTPSREGGGGEGRDLWTWRYKRDKDMIRDKESDSRSER